MDISVIFPIIYCIVALASLILYIAAFASHKYIGFIHYRKYPRKYPRIYPDAKKWLEWLAKQEMTPKRKVFAIIASTLIIADFVSLAVLNYNFYYWVKVFTTIGPLVILLSIFCTESLFGCISSIKRFGDSVFNFLFISGIATILLFVISMPAAEKKETVEITDLRAVDQEKNVFVIVEDEGAAYRYCKKGDGLLERVSSADAKVYLQYSYFEYDPPQVVERYQTPIRKYKVYGEEQEIVGKKQLAIVEICTPKKFVLELNTQRKT